MAGPFYTSTPLSYRPIFTDATVPVDGVERVATLSSSHAVMLPEDVEASFEAASPVVRLLALGLDLAIIFGACFVVLIISVIFGLVFGSFGVALGTILFGVIYLGYFFIFECLMAGQTIGKMAAGLRVIRLDGEEIGPREGLIRSFSRLPMILGAPLLIVWMTGDISGGVEGLVIAAACVDALPMFLDGRSRRFGDIVAGTLVITQHTPDVHALHAGLPGYFDLDRHHFPLRAEELDRLTPHDFTTLEEFGARIRFLRHPLRGQASITAAGALATKMRYPAAITHDKAERFLFEVHCALNEHLRQLYPDLYAA